MPLLSSWRNFQQVPQLNSLSWIKSKKWMYLLKVCWLVGISSSTILLTIQRPWRRNQNLVRYHGLSTSGFQSVCFIYVVSSHSCYLRTVFHVHTNNLSYVILVSLHKEKWIHKLLFNLTLKRGFELLKLLYSHWYTTFEVKIFCFAQIDLERCM